MTESRVAEAEMPGFRRIELDVDGMSCGACARRVANKLNKLEGVRASVDFGSKVAIIEADSAVSVSELCEAVQNAGYRARQRSEGAAKSEDAPVHQKTGMLQSVGAFVAVFARWLISPLHR